VKKIIEKKLEKKTNFTCPIDLQQKEKTGNDLRGREKMVKMLPLLNNDEDGAQIKPWFRMWRVFVRAL
jgi:hypothetical protein